MSEELLKIIAALKKNLSVINYDPVGSRVTCNPAPTDTDEDLLVYVHNIDAFHGSLVPLGFQQDGNPELYEGIDEEDFRSFRCGNINIIATSQGQFYERFMVATNLAKRFNLLDKSDRIALFRGVLYGAPTKDITPASTPIPDIFENAFNGQETYSSAPELV